ncbi:MAG: DHH family phosphoesterase [Halobacteriaceae archaeon]
MDAALIDDTRSLERKSLLPGRGFFVPDDLERDHREREVAEALAGEPVAVVADPDADGLACTAIVREAFGDGALVPTGPHDLANGLDLVAKHLEDDATVLICDLCPDDVESVQDPLDALTDRAAEVRWFDHHQWDDAVAAAVRDAGVDLVVGESDVECTADVALRAIESDHPARLVELAAVTRDHDLWVKEDDRSDDLADYAHWAESPEAYVETVREHGPDLPEAVQDLLAERRTEKAALIERAVDRAEMREVAGYTVGITYGRCSQNEVAEALREKGADAAVIVKPAGSASLRGTDSFERCHEVAGRLRGGGHPKAAGCKPRIYDDMLDYANHWVTEGAVARQVILDAFRAVVASESSAEAAED